MGDLHAEKEECVHAAQFELADQLPVNFVLEKRQHIANLDRTLLTAMCALLRPTHASLNERAGSQVDGRFGHVDWWAH